MKTHGHGHAHGASDAQQGGAHEETKDETTPTSGAGEDSRETPLQAAAAIEDTASAPGASPEQALAEADSLTPHDCPSEQTASAAAADPSGEVHALRKQLEEMKGQVDQYRRHAAEMDNARKRMIRDRERDLADKQISLLKGLLPVVDNLERALDSLMKTSDPEAVKAGTQQIFALFHSFLERQGVKPIPAVGVKYDPHFHEAVMQVASEEHAAGLISSELEKGYVLGERVLRHSKVVVSTGAAPAAAASKGDGGSEPS